MTKRAAASGAWALGRREFGWRRVVALSMPDGGFEGGPAPRRVGIPRVPGIWQGDAAEITSGLGGVRPHEGARMLRFLATSSDPRGTPGTKQFTSDLWRVVTLPAGLTGGVRVRAYFNAGTGAGAARFHVWAFVGTGSGETMPEVWQRRVEETRFRIWP